MQMKLFEPTAMADVSVLSLMTIFNFGSMFVDVIYGDMAGLYLSSLCGSNY